VLADYHEGHPNIVPKQYFKKIEVLQGGIGQGTRTRLTARILGQTRTVQHLISEPQPGRVLVETDIEGSSVTTFTVDPSDNGRATHLTISTDFRTRDGLAGAIERTLMSLVFPKIYRQELGLIAAYVGHEK
jgi:hypothetical protein